MSVSKFKVGDVVKCVNTDTLSTLTVGKEYVLVAVNNNGIVKVENDKGVDYCYYHYRFELCDSANAKQPPKFKEGDMVYLIGFGCLKPRKLQTGFNNGSPMKFKVMVDDMNNFETFTEDGKFITHNATPSIVLATEENRKMLNKLLGVEYEPSKLTGSDLAKKLLKDKPQTCYVSDDYASSNRRIDLIVKFENDRFISKSGVGWKFAVPCDQHGRILEDE